MMATLEDIRQKTMRMRRDIVAMAAEGKTSHVGSALSCVEILAVLYFKVMNISPRNWQSAGADRFILSKGHGAMAWYAALAEAGFVRREQLAAYAADGGRLGEHPSHGAVPGIILSTGSLGHGLSVAAGMALARKIDGLPSRVFAVLSDGECNEGSVWEAAMCAAHRQLDNLIVVIDDNRWQALGRSREVNALEPFKDKWTAFGWQAYQVDGHDVGALAEVLSGAVIRPGRPSVVIARTCLGKGVSFMEDDLLWHYQIPSREQLQKALEELGPA